MNLAQFRKPWTSSRQPENVGG